MLQIISFLNIQTCFILKNIITFELKHMCYFGACWLILGCSNYRRVINTPVGYQDPPNHILCLSCGQIGKGVYTIDESRAHCCFIPCCCTYDQSDPMMSCSNCNVVFGMTPVKCHGCDVYSTVHAPFCASCGSRSSVDSHISRPPTRGNGGGNNNNGINNGTGNTNTRGSSQPDQNNNNPTESKTVGEMRKANEKKDN